MPLEINLLDDAHLVTLFRIHFVDLGLGRANLLGVLAVRNLLLEKLELHLPYLFSCVASIQS